MANYQQLMTFNTGKLFLRDSSGNSYQVGFIDDVSLNIQGETKEYKGSYKWPIVTVQTGMKIDGKATFRQIDGRLITAIMSGSSTAGRIVPNDYVVTGSSVTVSPTGTAFDRDLGVLDSQGRPLVLTASAPAVGAYSRSGSVYTFNASEADNKTISYTYSTGSGYTLTGANAVQGVQTYFGMLLSQADPNDGDVLSMELPNVVIPGLNFAWKVEDFGSYDLSFTAAAVNGAAPYKIYLP